MSDNLFHLKRILFDLQEKTGVCVRFSPRGFQETAFTLEYCSEQFAAYLDGEGEGAAEQIKLLRYLVANSDAEKLFPEKEEALKNILLGEGGEWYAARFQTKHVLPEGGCYAIVFAVDRMVNESLLHVQSCLEEGRGFALFMDNSRFAVVKFSESGQSPEDYATFLALSLYEEIGVRASVGVGGECASFLQISASYEQAVTALRMSALFHSKGEVHSYREFLMVRMLEEVPQAKLKGYYEQLQTGNMDELFESEELLATAEAFLENSLNVSETSRSLYLHRNTLMYRLDKIERVSGLNIRKFSDAVSFRLITVLHKLLSR